MKIYFSGAHSSGKSTLARYTSEKYKLPMISETARMILSEQELQIDSLRSNLDVANQYQKNVFDRQIIEETNHNEFVSDRCLIDILAYSGQHASILPELVNSLEFAQHLQFIKDAKTCIFFVRPSKVTLKSDGVRESLNWDGVVAIDAQIKLLFQMYDIKYFQINADSMQERIGMIDAVLSLHK